MKDLKGYLERMEKAMVEKLYFLNIVNLDEYDYVIDFGCANGAMLSAVAPLYNGVQFIGVDSNQTSLNLAKQKLELKNVLFFNNLLSASNAIKSGKKTAIILSSILHELPKPVLNNILKIIKGFNAIIVRDMFFDNKWNKKIKHADNFIYKTSSITQKQFRDFKKYHGNLNNTKKLYHMLLKYTYIDNWETEVKENYFSVPWNKINKVLVGSGFKVFYEENYTLKFKQNEVLSNFNYNLIHPTHKNIIYIKM